MCDANDKFDSYILTFWSPLPPVWPTVSYLTDVIRESDEFKKYCVWRLKYPQRDWWKGLSDEKVITAKVKTIAEVLEERWFENQRKANVLDEVVLLKNCPSSFEEPYSSQDRIVSRYFSHVARKIVDQLYFSGKVYMIEELEQLVPHSTCAQFCRESIMLDYMEKMVAQKPRSDAWNEQIIVLRDIIQAKR